MATTSAYTVTLLAKAGYGMIDGNPYAIWTYRIAWSGKKPKARLGLAFSSRIDIKDPAAYPNLPLIQATRVAVTAGDERQYVYQDIDPTAATQLDLSLLAPSVEDAFLAVQLATAVPEAGSWQYVAFRVDAGESPSLVQTIRGPSVVAPQAAQPAPAPQLDNSSRRVEKCTLVSFKLDPPDDKRSGRALIKFGFLRQLGLQSGEVDQIETGMSMATREMLKAFEGAPIPSMLPSPGAVAQVPANELRSFANALIHRRQRMLDSATTDLPTAEILSATASARSLALNQLNAAITAANWFEANFSVTPIGMLNLERIEMMPVGIERGGLVATIPLAPLERTAVVHKEWSVTSQEFTSIVTDSLENYSETGVTENTELAQSTQSQVSHSNQFNVNGTVTGRYGPVTATVSSGFTAQNQGSDSASDSRKHAIDTTRKASTRVKQEHKTTISTTTVTGTAESSTRVLENPSKTDPIRIDYFSIMRKWQVGLYRYGLRLTYDIAIPEPGAALRKIYAQIEELNAKIGPFTFNETHAGINQNNYLQLADAYGAQVPLYPTAPPDIYVTADPPNTPSVNAVTLFDMPPLNIPDGYWITNLFFSCHFESHTGPAKAQVAVLGSPMTMITADQGDFGPTELTSAAHGQFRLHAGGACVVTVWLCNTTNTWLQLRAVIAPMDSTIAQWQSDVWNALLGAAQNQYYLTQQQYQNQIAALQAQIDGVDTLTLRREENEEIMKCVLRWLLGPSFDFMPADVRALFASQADLDLKHGTTFDNSIGDGLNVTAAGWFPMFMYQEMVKFINEAIEWENVLYFLYSYFWDVPDAWDFIRQIRHPDATRQAFLRAGSARVVLTVRKGWESAWVQFVEAGGFGTQLTPGHPYLTIAQEIQAYDSTNYPGIPPANPGGGPLPDDGESVASQSSDKLAPSAGPVTLSLQSSEGFLVGYTAIIDDYSTGTTTGGQFVTAQETQKILAVPDKTHITIERLTNAHDGSLKPFPVMQGGEKGQLIAQWFEYTPTSGTDIAVTSNLATIS